MTRAWARFGAVICCVLSRVTVGLGGAHQDSPSEPFAPADNKCHLSVLRGAWLSDCGFVGHIDLRFKEYAVHIVMVIISQAHPTALTLTHRAGSSTYKGQSIYPTG